MRASHPVGTGLSWRGRAALVPLGALLGVSAPALAASESEIQYAPPAAWVQPPPLPTDRATPADAPLRVIYTDAQVHVGPAGNDTYSAYRMRVLKPEALTIGRVGVGWNPAGGGATVHHVRIVRDGQTIDVLKDSRFQIIQREEALEQSVLTGDLTAMLQVPGLRVGDELEVATTVRRRDPTLSDHTSDLLLLSPQDLPGAFRVRVAWSETIPLKYRSSRDLPVAVPVSANGERAVTFELRDPPGSIVNEGAPARYNIRRLIEYSTFDSWEAVSSRMAPLYAEAATIPAGSPLREQIAAIAARSSDPVVRAEGALQLVQNEVRYVYVGLDGGNLRPASVEETWQRRFGDCKAKTLLLLAILRELRIEAEPVLVNPTGDDGLNQRLPSISVFNHVLVRATIAGKAYWLDGTRLGDRSLSALPEPSFAWALPVRAKGATLLSVPQKPFARPQFVGIMTLDAIAGFEAPAKVSMQYVLRGDGALSLRSRLSALSAADAERALRSYWRQEEGWITADNVSWKFDEARNSIAMTVKGTAKPDWSGDDKEGRSLTIWRAGFPPPDRFERPKDQDSSAPWLTGFPQFSCWASTIRLPAPARKFNWAYDAAPMNQVIGGVAYWRQAALANGVIRVVKSRSVEQREISARDADLQTQSISNFNNRMSQVFETTDAKTATVAESEPFKDDVDWVADDGACIARPAK